MTLIEALAVIVCVVFIFILLGLIDFGTIGINKERAKKTLCISHLKQVGIAFRTWEGDHEDQYPMNIPITNGGSMEWAAGNNMFRHFQVMSNELNNPKILFCPADEREWAHDFANLSNSNLSYFIGLDADESRPNMVLMGDRNLMTNGVAVGPGLAIITTNSGVGWTAKMHKLAGNVVFGDGSVLQLNNASLQTYINRTGTNVNRLAVP